MYFAHVLFEPCSDLGVDITGTGNQTTLLPTVHLVVLALAFPHRVAQALLNVLLFAMREWHFWLRCWVEFPRPARQYALDLA